MNANIVSGATIAAAAIALALCGATAPALANKMSKTVHCSGINSCKGQGCLPEKSAKAGEAKGGTVAEM